MSSSGDVTYNPPLGLNRISTTAFNSRDSANLGANLSFQGVGEDVSAYARVGVSVNATNQCSGTLFMQVSRDGVNFGGPARTISDARFAQPHMWNIVEQYFRILYINGPIAAENLTIQVQYSSNSDIFLGHQLDEELQDSTEAIVTRSVLVGSDSKKKYNNVEVDISGRLQVIDVNIISILEELLTEQKLTNAYLKSISNDDMVEN